MPPIPTKSNETKYAYMGIDPGKKGGIVTIWQGLDILLTSMPETERGVDAHIKGVVESCRVHKYTLVALIEQVHAMPKQGVKSMFTFGMGYGGLRMALISNRVPFEEVRPQVWQKALCCNTRGDKNVTIKKAQQIFPELEVWSGPKYRQEAVADALLIALFFQRKSEGRL